MISKSATGRQQVEIGNNVRPQRGFPFGLCVLKRHHDCAAFSAENSVISSASNRIYPK